MTTDSLRAAFGAERRSVVMLVLALATVIAVGSSPSRFHLWKFDHGSITVDQLAFAPSRSFEHGFIGYEYRYLNGAGELVYEAYNRFPIGGQLLIQRVMEFFPDDLAAQLHATRTLMLAFFAAAVVLAYLSLRRLTGSPSVGLAATLLAFSSFFPLHYADMVASEGSMDLFAVLLAFHGLVLFAQEGRYGQLLAKTCAAVLIGWHVFALLLPFVVLGVAAEWLRSDGGILHRTGRALRSRHVALGVVALAFGLSMLALNFGLEHAASVPERGAAAPRPTLDKLRNWSRSYEVDAPGESSPTGLSSLRSMSKRLGWSADFNARHADAVDWLPLLNTLFERAGRAALPYVVERAARKLLGARGEGSVEARRGRHSIDASWQRSAPAGAPRSPADSGAPARAAWLLGAFVFVVAAVGAALDRHRVLLATLASCGLCWGLLVRGSVPFHPFEGMFLVGLPLVFHAVLLTRVRTLLQRRGMSVRWIDGIAGIALLAFVLSSLQTARLGPGSAKPSDLQVLLADAAAVRRVAPEDAVVIAHLEPRGETQLLLTGRTLLAPQNGAQRQRAGFVFLRHRLAHAGLLTPENRLVFLYDRLAYDARYASLGDPALEGGQGWKVHLIENRLIYTTGARCDARQGFKHEPPFFLEAFPARPSPPGVFFSELPIYLRMEFRFDESRFEVAGRCIAELPPPAYDVARIRTGQLSPGGDLLWSGELAVVAWPPSPPAQAEAERR